MFLASVSLGSVGVENRDYPSILVTTIGDFNGAVVLKWTKSIIFLKPEGGICGAVLLPVPFFFFSFFYLKCLS